MVWWTFRFCADCRAAAVYVSSGQWHHTSHIAMHGKLHLLMLPYQHFVFLGGMTGKESSQAG
jgi:hypothetical protein